MKLLLTSLLLASLRVRSFWSVSSSGTLVVTQTPDLSVMEGGTAHITCCWTGEFERMRVHWLKNQTNIKIETVSKNNSKGSLRKETSDCLTLTFMNITREASGRYTCKLSMEIPVFGTAEGNGTVITVMARDNPEHDTTAASHKGDVLIYVLRCLPILVLLITFCCLNKLGTKAQQHSTAPPGNNLPSAQGTEKDQEEEERDERVIETE